MLVYEYDYEQLFYRRLTALREAKHVSAREMSLALGQSGSYINSIENHYGFPTFSSFFAICVYLGVTPKEFFDDGSADPAYLRELIEDLKGLDARDLEMVSRLVKRLRTPLPDKVPIRL